ncbi:M20 family metallo-hydrolase [Providencia rettgeri]|uniref:M20 family metallo-hydrolase n=1 Tax=Providencia rettgeri TaxID=587 RepID=UPI00029C12B5|nr:M20 family metallo-hydrolase [Providencia rettgeri]EKT56840.1 allantoate amidohydrolase [Providencia rettgeri Dmel1]
MKSKLCINSERLMSAIFELGTLGALPKGGCCRIAGTPQDKLGRDFVVAKMQSLGLKIRIDEIGNVTGIYSGHHDLPPVMMGSHIDTVGTGGLYDGNYGVLAGLEVINTLKDANIQPYRPIAVTFFTNEEGVRFQPDMMGSVVFAEQYPLEDALAAKDLDGICVEQALLDMGYKGEAKIGSFPVDSYFELHIEQGPILDKENINIGIVTGVQGISWTEYKIEGVSNHAGTTPMSMRHDAGLVAFKMGAFAREITQTLGDNQVATAGFISLKPNLINVIPNQATLTIDLRNTDNNQLKKAEKMMQDYAQKIAAEEGILLNSRTLARFDPVVFSDTIIDAIEHEVKQQNLSYKKMPSGAGHDAQFMANICPSGMIFVPCAGGISHNINEFSEPEDLARGANILLNVVLQRAQHSHSEDK